MSLPLTLKDAMNALIDGVPSLEENSVSVRLGFIVGAKWILSLTSNTGEGELDTALLDRIDRDIDDLVSEMSKAHERRNGNG